MVPQDQERSGAPPGAAHPSESGSDPKTRDERSGAPPGAADPSESGSDPKTWDIGEDRQVVGRALAFTGKVVAARFVETLARCGGSLPAWMVLLNLAGTGPISQRELAERIHVEGATVTYHLDRLEAAGLVTRQRDPDDRRVWRAELTPAGRETFERMKQGALAFETALRAGLDDAELAQFFKILDRLTENAEAFDPANDADPQEPQRRPGRSPGGRSEVDPTTPTSAGVSMSSAAPERPTATDLTAAPTPPPPERSA